MTTLTSQRSRLFIIVLAFAAFISLGLPDGLLGVAWPSIRAKFSLPLDSLGPLLAMGTVGYLLSSFMSGRIVARIGVGWLLALSCLATSCALIGYTLAPVWPLFVMLGFVGGAGAGAIDAGLNTYIATHHGPGLMQWLHASFGVGTTTGPLIMTTVLAAGQSWRVGYVIVGAAQLLLATCFMVTSDRWNHSPKTATNETQKLTDYKTSLRETLRQPAVWMSVLMFILYTGLELTVGQWTYTLLTESRHIATDVAGLMVSMYWGSFTVGRIMAGMFAGRIRTVALVQLSLFGALCGALLLWWNSAEIIGLLGIALLGFSFAPIFPALISGTASRVGDQHAANTIGFQIGAASIGVAIIPGLAGALARRTSLEIIAPFLLVIILTLTVVHELVTRRKAAQ